MKLTEPLFGKERWCILRKPPLLLGTKPSGEDIKGGSGVV
jgi:hypothetical protein